MSLAVWAFSVRRGAEDKNLLSRVDFLPAVVAVVAADATDPDPGATRWDGQGDGGDDFDHSQFALRGNRDVPVAVVLVADVDDQALNFHMGPEGGGEGGDRDRVVAAARGVEREQPPQHDGRAHQGPKSLRWQSP